MGEESSFCLSRPCLHSGRVTCSSKLKDCKLLSAGWFACLIAGSVVLWATRYREDFDCARHRRSDECHFPEAGRSPTSAGKLATNVRKMEQGLHESAVQALVMHVKHTDRQISGKSKRVQCISCHPSSKSLGCNHVEGSRVTHAPLFSGVQ